MKCLNTKRTQLKHQMTRTRKECFQDLTLDVCPQYCFRKPPTSWFYTDRILFLNLVGKWLCREFCHQNMPKVLSLITSMYPTNYLPLDWYHDPSNPGPPDWWEGILPSPKSLPWTQPECFHRLFGSRSPMMPPLKRLWGWTVVTWLQSSRWPCSYKSLPAFFVNLCIGFNFLTTLIIAFRSLRFG